MYIHSFYSSFQQQSGNQGFTNQILEILTKFDFNAGSSECGIFFILQYCQEKYNAELYKAATNKKRS